MASEAVSKKSVMLGPFLDRIFTIFQTPRGGSTRHERPRLWGKKRSKKRYAQTRATTVRQGQK